MPDQVDRLANDLLWTLPMQYNDGGDSASRQIRNPWVTDGDLKGLTTTWTVVAFVSRVPAGMAIIFDLAMWPKRLRASLAAGVRG